MNFIFDIGNVLIDFKPEQFLHSLFNNPILEAKINKTIFKSEEWIMLDLGKITPEQALENFCEREPEYAQYLKEVMDKIPDMLTPIEDTAALLPEIKKRGHNLYYLSNYHKGVSIDTLSKNHFFKLFEGGVFSCDIHVVKPSPEIYQHLLDKYELKAKECVFFDDTKANVEAAINIGIQGVLFAGAKDVENFLKIVN